MERSASLPASGFDYQLPKHGIGETGPAKRTLLGNVPKDKGGYSSRINQIVRQAGKVPGPGMYVGHEDWSLNGGSKFANLERTYKPCNKIPPPNHYETKDIMDNKSIRSRANLSQNPSLLYGKMPKGKKRSFLDQATQHGKFIPGAGHYEPRQKSSDRMEPKIKGALSWEKEMQKSKSGKAPEKEIAPNHYNPSHSLVSERVPNYTWPKEKANNFIDKSVREKLLDPGIRDAKSRKELPGPGTYPTHTADHNKLSRGTFHLQLRGLSRSAASGYF